MRSESTYKLAVVSMNRDKYSETFIHDSYDFFPCNKTLLFGAYLPDHFTETRTAEGNPIPTAKQSYWNAKPKDAEAQKALNLMGWLKTFKPNAILAHYGPSGVALGPIAQGLKVPMVVHFHGYDAYRSDILERYGEGYRNMFAKAQALVVVSEDMRRQLLELGAPPEKLFLLHYGIDPNRFVAQPYPTGTPYYIYVGRFVAKKAPELLVRAFADVVKEIPAAQLTMAGDGELRERCMNLAAELGLGENIDFPGVLAREAVADLLAHAFALVLPSMADVLGDHEGTPLVILEAGASARPVVASRHGGIPDVIVHEKNGLLVPEGDGQALTKAMLAIAHAPERSAAMGIAGREEVLARFTQTNYHARLWGLLGPKQGRASI